VDVCFLWVDSEGVEEAFVSPGFKDWFIQSHALPPVLKSTGDDPDKLPTVQEETSPHSDSYFFIISCFVYIFHNMKVSLSLVEIDGLETPYPFWHSLYVKICLDLRRLQ